MRRVGTGAGPGDAAIVVHLEVGAVEVGLMFAVIGDKHLIFLGGVDELSTIR